MKVLTILGTRPEIIRLSLILPVLDRCCEHVVVYTGQNYSPNLSNVFFEDLGVRCPDINFGVREASFGAQIGQIIALTEKSLLEHRPDRLLTLGDTNSALSALVASRMGIPVYHMEAGNRCFDDRVPEEVNRRAIDHCSSVLMPYTNRSKENLLREGIAINHIYVTGNPIGEVVLHYRERIEVSTALDRLQLTARHFFLATFHRQENVDSEDRLRGIVLGLQKVQEAYGFPVVCSVHPRTADKIQRYSVNRGSLIFVDAMGFFDFVHLEQSAACVLTDSGTVQEECCILGVPAVTMRDVTERPETLECGSNMLSGADPERIVSAVRMVMSCSKSWKSPAEYQVSNVADTVAKIVLGF